MRADTWADVRDVWGDALGALWSRLRNYAPAEQARRESLDAEFRATIQRIVATDPTTLWQESDDTVGAWMHENGFTQRTFTGGSVDEATEVKLDALSEQFRKDISDALGQDVDYFRVEMGVVGDDDEEEGDG